MAGVCFGDLTGLSKVVELIFTGLSNIVVRTFRSVNLAEKIMPISKLFLNSEFLPFCSIHLSFRKVFNRKSLEEKTFQENMEY